jgi:3-oxoacyl-[acyl-carrier-protein] synthase-3
MRIIGLASETPRTVVSNEELTHFLDTSDEWISLRTGIKTRCVITDEHFEDLAVTAAKKAMEDSLLSKDEIDLVICPTVISPFITPSIASIVHARLNLSCPALDINAACAGFIYALDVCESYLLSKKAKNILVVCAENLSRFADWTDRSTCVLFGDGAGAVIVNGEPGIEGLFVRTQDDPDTLVSRMPKGNSPFLVSPIEGHYLKMQGQEVFKMAVHSCLADIKKALALSKKKMEDISYFLLHQANMRIINSVRQRLNAPKEKFKHNIENYGNTSSASIPILMDEMYRKGELKNGDRLLLDAFGAGFVSGACVVNWNK